MTQHDIVSTLIVRKKKKKQDKSTSLGNHDRSLHAICGQFVARDRDWHDRDWHDTDLRAQFE